MRLSIVGPVNPYRGGISHYTMHLIRKLMDRGHETQVISFQRQYPTWLYPGESDKDPSANPLTVPAKYLLDPLHPWTWAKTARQISQFEPQIVAIQWWTTFWAPAFAFLGWWFKQQGKEVVFMIHNVLPHEEKAWDRWLARLVLSKGTHFIAQTRRERERLLNLIPGLEVTVCPIPVFDALDKGQIPKNEARRKLHLPSDRLVLLSFGIVRPYKGLHVLLEAVGELQQRGQEVITVVAGDFWEDKDVYLQQIDRLGIGEQILIDDRYIPDEEVALYFSAADALVAPYIAGTQSAVASWGLSFGIPMIVSDLVAAGIPDELKKQVLVSPAGDSTALAKTITEFLQAPLQTKPIPKSSNDGWMKLVDKLEAIHQGKE